MTAGAQRELNSLAGEKAAVLVEALPYIRRFSGSTVVIKYGGNAIVAGPPRGSHDQDKQGEGTLSDDPLSDDLLSDDPQDVLASFAEDVVLLRSVGVLPVVVHGGGPQIGALMERLGKRPAFVNGLRVTDAETLEIARMVLVGKINREIVSAINVHGGLAVGLSGEDANLIRAVPHGESGLGFVGEVEVLDTSIVTRLLGDGLIPVIATIGADAQGQAYNINADSVAGALAAGLGAEKLVFLTDVEGIRTDPTDPLTLASSLSVDELDDLVATGAVQTGMVPKARACSEAVRAGVGRAHVLDGRTPHALLLELLTEQGVGTMITEAAPQATQRGGGTA